MNGRRSWLSQALVLENGILAICANENRADTLSLDSALCRDEFQSLHRKVVRDRTWNPVLKRLSKVAMTTKTKAIELSEEWGALVCFF
jgi:hypothetical protein